MWLSNVLLVLYSIMDDSNMQTLLEDIRARRVPVDFLQIFHALRIPFYDGKLQTNRHTYISDTFLITLRQAPSSSKSMIIEIKRQANL